MLDKKLEIMFSDLNKKAKNKVLKFFKIKTPEEANLDLSPLAIINKGVNEICMNCKHSIVSSSDEGTNNYICTFNENIVDAEDVCNEFEEED